MQNFLVLFISILPGKWDLGRITFPYKGQAAKEILTSSNWHHVLLVLDCKETQGYVFLQIY